MSETTCFCILICQGYVLGGLKCEFKQFKGAPSRVGRHLLAHLRARMCCRVCGRRFHSLSTAYTHAVQCNKRCVKCGLEFLRTDTFAERYAHRVACRGELSTGIDNQLNELRLDPRENGPCYIQVVAGNEPLNDQDVWKRFVLRSNMFAICLQTFQFSEPGPASTLSLLCISPALISNFNLYESRCGCPACMGYFVSGAHMA